MHDYGFKPHGALVQCCTKLKTLKKKEVNQSHYRPEVPRGFQEVKVPRLRDNGGGKVVSLTHRPPLPPRITPGTHFCWGTAVAQWLRCCATNPKFAASIPAGVRGFFIDIKFFRSH